MKRISILVVLLAIAAGAQAFFGKLDGEPAHPVAYQCELVTRYNASQLPAMEITYRGEGCPWLKGAAFAVASVATANP